MDDKILTKEEFDKVTETFFNRLEDEMSTAGCNDLYEDEFPKSVCDKFGSDIEVLEIWKSMILKQ